MRRPLVFVAAATLLVGVPALLIANPFSGPFGGGGRGGVNTNGGLCLDTTCTTYLDTSDGGVTLVGAPFAAAEGFTDGTLARADDDVYGNTFVANPSNSVDGGVGVFGFICNQSPCTWKLGMGSQEELTAEGNILTANFGQVNLPTTQIAQATNPVNTTMRWFVPTAGHYFGFFPTTDTTGCAVGTAGGVRYLSTTNALVVCNGSANQRLAVDTPTTLPTCAAALEGLSLVDAAAGGTSGARTRRCLCTSDGAGSPAYAWQNLATGTVDTATTCAP